MQLRGLISMSDFYDLTEVIAQLIDAKLSTSIEDLSNINDLIVKEIEVAYRAEQQDSVEINGGSK
jgi:zona occludens toxin (predicted ATPase)